VRLERTWGVRLTPPAPLLETALAACLDAWERGLDAIDFPEVTDEDRVTFLEHLVSVQVRHALRAGRFDLALELRACAARRVLELDAGIRGWRPVLIYGMPVPARPRGERGLTTSPASRT
jgi:hypothetical protein